MYHELFCLGAHGFCCCIFASEKVLFTVLQWHYIQYCKISVLSLLRIRDVYHGSRILSFTHSGSRILTQQQKTVVKKFVVIPFFCSHKFHKLENYLIFEVLKKKIWANLQRILELFTQRIVTMRSNIWVWDPGSEIRKKNYSGSRGQKGNGSATLVLILKKIDPWMKSKGPRNVSEGFFDKSFQSRNYVFLNALSCILYLQKCAEMSTSVCYKCEKTGHFARECPEGGGRQTFPTFSYPMVLYIDEPESTYSCVEYKKGGKGRPSFEAVLRIRIRIFFGGIRIR